MKVSKIRKGLVLVVAAGAFGLGCELVVDFDRTRIPVETTDAAVLEGGAFDAPVDTFAPDTGTQDTGVDAEASIDAGADADAGEDADAALP